MGKEKIIKKEPSKSVAKLLTIISDFGQSNLAKELGVHPSKFQAWKTGISPTLEAMIEISKVIPVDWNSIIYDSPKEMIVATPDLSESEKALEIESLKKQLTEIVELKILLNKSEGKIEAYENIITNFINSTKGQ